MHVELDYLDEPIIQLKLIRFQQYKFDERKHLSSKHENFTEAWLLASFFSNKVHVRKEDRGQYFNKQ